MKSTMLRWRLLLEGDQDGRTIASTISEISVYAYFKLCHYERLLSNHYRETSRLHRGHVGRKMSSHTYDLWSRLPSKSHRFLCFDAGEFQPRNVALTISRRSFNISAFGYQACVEPVLKVNLFVRQDRQSKENKNNPELHTFFYLFTDSQWITPSAFLGLWESSLESVPKLSRGAYKEVEINRMIPAVVYWLLANKVRSVPESELAVLVRDGMGHVA
ncbi:hypothetical protein IFM89_023687 [Coptis chinensis]|uniref:Uncharacterized protein n=1 Tax=Coptis chinensis TaxID=261450 RepID=A0A835GXK2_9MAGN|nr:hypothetical protein IFM89_023687 [Coptis chinensis]